MTCLTPLSLVGLELQQRLPRLASGLNPKRSPLRLGYRTNVWTVELLADRLYQQYGCAIRPRTLRRRMRQMGLRCKRPRYVYSEKEPHLSQKKGPLPAD
jgi:transposase